MREERYARLCGNMKHGRYTLHSAGEDACAPMSGAPMPRVRYTYSVHCVPVSDIRLITGRKDGCFKMALSRRDKLLVENGLFYKPRPVRDAIWVEVIGKSPSVGREPSLG